MKFKETIIKFYDLEKILDVFENKISADLNNKVN